MMHTDLPVSPVSIMAHALEWVSEEWQRSPWFAIRVGHREGQQLVLVAVSLTFTFAAPTASSSHSHWFIDAAEASSQHQTVLL